MTDSFSAARAASSTLSSGIRPLLRPCKSDIEDLTRLHSLKGGLGSPAEKASEARSLLIQHGPLVGVYPCWHPIRRFLMRQEQKPALEYDAALPNDPFDHGRKFQWAIVGWPYSTLERLQDYVIKHRDALSRFHLTAEVVPSVLYNSGASHAIVVKVDPLIVRNFQGLSEDGWRAMIQTGYMEASLEYAHHRNITRMEVYADMQADYVGADSNSPGLHGRFHDAFDDHFVASLEPWHYAFQYRLIQKKNAQGNVPDEAYEKMIEVLGAGASALVRDSLLAARSI